MKKDLKHLLELKEGDTIRNKGSQELYTVIKSGSRPVAVKSVQVDNVTEWEILNR